MKSRTLMLSVVAICVLVSLYVCSDDSDAATVELNGGYMGMSDYYSLDDLEPGVYSLDFNVEVYLYGCDIISGYSYGDYFSTVRIHDDNAFVQYYGAGPVILDYVAVPDNETTYIVYNPTSNVAPTYFSVKAGTLTWSSLVGQTPDYIIIDGETINFSGKVNIPVDCDKAYFYSTYGSTVTGILTNTPYDYAHKGELYCGWSTYDPHNSLYFEKGNYTLTFSRDGELELSDEYVNFDAAVPKDIEVKVAGHYSFRVSPSYWGYTPNKELYSTYYNASPDISLYSKAPDVDYTIKKSGTANKWYSKEFVLDAGNHNISTTFYSWTFIKGSEDEIRFLSEVIDKNCNVYNSINFSNSSNFTLYQRCTVVVYVLADRYDIYNQTVEYYVDNDTITGPGELIVGSEYDSIYLQANEKAKLIVDYDSASYGLYLASGRDLIVIPDNMVVELSTDISREYLLVFEPYVMNSSVAFEAEYKIYTEGLLEPDDNGTIFAVVTIGLCAVFFGLLFISGRKPKWKD